MIARLRDHYEFWHCPECGIKFHAVNGLAAWLSLTLKVLRRRKRVCLGCKITKGSGGKR